MLAGGAKGFPGILYQIYTGSKTGELTLSTGEDVRKVYFYRGRPVMVTEARTSEPLGRVLLEMGIINQEAYDQSLIEMARTGRRQGEVLVDMGKITREQVRLALDAQLRKKLNRVFFLKDFTYEFKEGEEQIAPAGDFASAPKVATLAVIYHGIKNSMKEAELEQALGLDTGSTLALTGDYYSMSFSLPLSPEEVIIAEHMAGPSTIDSLLGLHVLTRTEILMLLYYLSLLDLLEVARGGAVQDAIPTVPPMPAEQAAIPPPPGAPAESTGGAAAAVAEPSVSNAVATAARPPTGEVLPPVEDPEAVKEMVQRYSNIAQMDYYEILGVQRGAEESAVRRAYFELMRRYHPANILTADEEAMHIAKILKVKANEAYATLASPNLRDEYDRAVSEANGRKDQEGQRAGDAELEYRKGDFYLRKGDFRAAVAAYRRALELHGQEPDYVAAYGWALYNDPDQAPEMREPMGRQYLRKAVVISPNCTRAFVHLASIARLENKIDEAEKYLAEAAKLDAGDESVSGEREAIAKARRASPAPAKPSQARIEKKGSGFFSKILGGGDEPEE